MQVNKLSVMKDLNVKDNINLKRKQKMRKFFKVKSLKE